MNHHLRAGACKAISWLSLPLLLAALALPVRAAEPVTPAPTAKRPKICLVLSGGGARGAAHVGVLKVLEEYRVPIHCIAGTSMGSLVGAAYASGTTVAEMDQIMANITKELLFKEKPPRAELSMRRKVDDYKPFFGPEIGIKDGNISLGKGIVTGVQLETVLRQLSKIKGYQNFDKLPIPFRAVATDLVNGKAVVFKDGELANVMRASMSVPGAVAPAEFDGMMLVDGMLTSNLPVDAARAMGADIVIAVNVGTPLLKREELTGIGGVLGQMLSILTEQNVQASLASLKPDDILITPELEGITTGDFDDLAKIAPRGEPAARKVAERLARLSIPAAEYAALRERQMIAVAPDVRPVDEIRFENLALVNPEVPRTQMRTKPGEPIDQKKLDMDMRRIYGTGDFEHVNYRYFDEPGKRILVVDAVEKSWGPDSLRFGLGLSSDFGGDALYNLLVSYRKRWINSLGAEWRTDLQMGSTTSLVSEFYQPLTSAGAFFIAPRVLLERSSAPVYQGDTRLATVDRKKAQVNLDLGANLYEYGTIRLGVLAGKVKREVDTGTLPFPVDSDTITLGAYNARVVLDQLDSAHFPREGWKADFSYLKSDTGLGADDSYKKWEVSGNFVRSFGEHTINLFAAAGDLSGSKQTPAYDQFSMGGFLRLSGLSTGQLIGENLKYGRAMYYHRLMRSSIFEGAYGGISLETGKMGNPLVPGNRDDWIRAASVFVAADTPLGPAYLGYGQAQDGPDSLYFFLGRPF
ncbi:MAG: patatin-like phospholipase family protein [Sulfuritalea sp.]|nr:patatin-like phospholipase family protein [Sulfuritalea sp.]